MRDMEDQKHFRELFHRSNQDFWAKVEKERGKTVNAKDMYLIADIIFHIGTGMDWVVSYNLKQACVTSNGKQCMTFIVGDKK